MNPLAPNTKTPIMRVAPASRPSASAPSNPTNGADTASASGLNGEPQEKPYSEMSKSEKMSWSMKSKHAASPSPALQCMLIFISQTDRWRRGEMRGAVEKRKNTLAQKQKAKVATDAQARAASAAAQAASIAPPPSAPAAPSAGQGYIHPPSAGSSTKHGEQQRVLQQPSFGSPYSQSPAPSGSYLDLSSSLPQCTKVLTASIVTAPSWTHSTATGAAASLAEVSVSVLLLLALRLLHHHYDSPYLPFTTAPSPSLPRMVIGGSS